MAGQNLPGIEWWPGKAGDCPFRYPGQYEDVETGLHYNRFRYYYPEEGSYINQDPIGLWGGVVLYGYTLDPLKYIDPLGLSAVYCGKTKRWRNANNQFIKRPTDPKDLINSKGKIDYSSLMEWEKGLSDWNPAKPGNQWVPASKFPTGGFKYDLKDPSGTRYRMHGHGANPSAPAGNNASIGPTTTIIRTGGDAVNTSGNWSPYASSPPNDVHIPLTNSPF